MTDLILGPFAGYIAAAVGVVSAALALWWSGRRSGAVARDLAAAKANAKSSEAGRVATGKARADLRKGQTPEQIVRDNDGAWK